MSETAKPVRIPDFAEKKRRGEKIAVLTAYDATMARLIDRAGVDAILVGDSLGMVVMGCETTLEVTMDIDGASYAGGRERDPARRGDRGHAVPQLPDLGVRDAVRNAGRLLAEGHAAAVKLEGGRAMAETVARLVEIGIPVMGHLGITPQSVHRLGGHQKLGMSEADRCGRREAAGAGRSIFRLSWNQIPTEAAKAITEALSIPTIGIGAGPHCDGQVLVSYDASGLVR